MKMVLAVALLSLAAPAMAQTPVQKKAEAACDAKIIEKMLAPLEAKAIPSSRKHHKNQYTACFQARTRGGGFGQVFGVCDYAADGSVIGVVRVIDDCLR